MSIKKIVPVIWLVLYIGLVFLVYFGVQAFAGKEHTRPPAMGGILQVDTIDQFCQVDSDCEVIADTCMSDSCGVGVRKDEAVKYNGILKDYCAAPFETDSERSFKSCPSTEARCVSNRCIATIPDSSVDALRGKWVSVYTDKRSYTLNDTTQLTIANDSGDDVWVNTTCGELPLISVKRESDGLVSYPTEGCLSRSLKIANGEKLVLDIDLAEVYGSAQFPLEDGEYSYALQYSTIDILTIGPIPQFVEIRSNKFTLE